ncbi:uncharacterized protein LOC114318341 [Camellia sinensis]|uniref:uncharacterized protein LOC114318341 n=1 Tax=Camellia sinensis TaxID=4442 RepID=UPI0010362424|nr:uncharacterized protein LOC114318341 [Camellia sinensis]
MPVPPPAPGCQTGDCTVSLTREFKKMKPPVFHGGIEPLKAEAWVLGIEKLFKVFLCTDAQRIQLAAFTLEDDARCWWMLVRDENKDVAWACFLEIFTRNTSRNVYGDRKVSEFMELKQGNKSVAKYETQLTELAHFTPHMVDTDYKKARQFEGGLRDPILDRVNVLKLPTYVDLLDRALIAEGNVANRKQNFEWKGRRQNFNKGKTLTKKKLKSGNSNNIPVVRDFPDVFPDELSGQLVNREIKFTIDVIPGTQPISKTFYLMSIIEMKELKTQLQELLEK